ncbi:MAG: AAA domain-containing protein, partial [Gaiellales bacterium]
ALRDWLLAQRADAAAAGIIWPIPPATVDATDTDLEAGSEDADPHPTRVLVERLEAVAEDEARSDQIRLAARLLSAMPGWQRRTQREFFGDLYGRMHDRDAEDYEREPSALGRLKLIDTELIARDTTLRTYSFPPQVTLVSKGQTAIDPTCVRTVGTIDAIDLDATTVTIRTTKSVAERHASECIAAGDDPGALPISIIGWTDIRVNTLEAAARGIAERFLATLEAGGDPLDAAEPDAAALSMLARVPTRTTSGLGPEAVTQPPTPEQLVDLVQRCDGSHLIVQGPPGTGKTWTSARLIVMLAEAGLRVGISSNSHDAIANVLRGIDAYRAERLANGQACDIRAAYALRKGEKAPGRLEFGEPWIQRPKDSKAAAALLTEGQVQVLAGTAWQLVQEAPLDVVLIDEAGQVSLLHATAMASQTRRVVLVGDPQQLPQPSSATHPHGCDASVLDHLFEGAAVLPPERAVLLPITRRMHPRVCEHISDTYYLGELESHPSTQLQHVSAVATGLPSAGVVLRPVEHRGNRSSSPEEVAAIVTLVDELLQDGRTVPHPDQLERAITREDIIVVAPYNAQRTLLEQALGPDVRVGTVDKFQGQEAPVAILSLTASSRDELPRGLEFLLDPHRMNVAISRARALAIVVASPALLAIDAESVHEMRLLNDLVRIARRCTA